MHPQKHLKKKGTWKSVITNVSMCGCVQTSAANTPGRDGRGDLWCVGVAVSFIERGTRGSGVAHKVLLTFILRNKAEAAKQTQKPPAGKEGWWQRCRQRLIQEWSQVSITAKSRLCPFVCQCPFLLIRSPPQCHFPVGARAARAPTGSDAGDVTEAVTLSLRSLRRSPWWQFVIRPQRPAFSRQTFFTRHRWNL